MTVYITYSPPREGNVSECVIYDQNIPFDEFKAMVERISAECIAEGVTATFRTYEERLAEFLDTIRTGGVR